MDLVARLRSFDFARLRSSLLLPYLATIFSALPLGALMAAANPKPEGACEGIGWGCSLYGWDAVGFLLIFIGIPYIVVLGIVVGLLALLPPRLRPLATAVAWTGLAIPWLLVLLGAGMA